MKQTLALAVAALAAVGLIAYTLYIAGVEWHLLNWVYLLAFVLIVGSLLMRAPKSDAPKDQSRAVTEKVGGTALSFVVFIILIAATQDTCTTSKQTIKTAWNSTVGPSFDAAQKTRDEAIAEAERRRNTGKVANTCQPTRRGNVVTLPACFSGWYNLGSVKEIRVDGTIDIGGRQASAGHSPIAGTADARFPTIGYGLPVIKVGAGDVPQELPVDSFIEGGGADVYVAINDSIYTDNHGAYTLTIRP